MRVYIAGPMTQFRDQNYNFAAFYKAQGILEMAGHIVENPARMDIEEGRAKYVAAEGRIVLAPEFTMADAMRRDVKRIADVDAIVLLPGWESSTGANKELRVAIEDFGMPAYVLRQDATGWPILQPLEEVDATV